MKRVTFGEPVSLEHRVLRSPCLCSLTSLMRTGNIAFKGALSRKIIRDCLGDQRLAAERKAFDRQAALEQDPILYPVRLAFCCLATPNTAHLRHCADGPLQSCVSWLPCVQHRQARYEME